MPECPTCGYKYRFLTFDEYFTMEDSGTWVNQEFFMIEHWYTGYLTCPDCWMQIPWSDSSL